MSYVTEQLEREIASQRTIITSGEAHRRRAAELEIERLELAPMGHGRRLGRVAQR